MTKIVMIKRPIPRITFDTNVCNVIHNPDKRPTKVTPEVARKIRAAISDRCILGFVSEATTFVECLSFPDKLAYLAVAGTPDCRPSPDLRMIAIFDDLASLGMTLLHAPLIGSEKFVESIPWAEDEIYPIEKRQTLFGDFISPFPRHLPLIEYGRSLLVKQSTVPQPNSIHSETSLSSLPIPQLWAKSIKRAWDEDLSGQRNLEKIVRPIIGEWCDCLIVGSHMSYGNDIFCTTDMGKNAGTTSLLHHTNRERLVKTGIRIMTPGELVLHLAL